MKNLCRDCALGLLFILFAAGPHLTAQPTLDEMRTGIECSLQQEYQAALDLFADLHERYPDHPAPPFFLAAVYQSMMLDFETTRWEEQFYHWINRAIDLAENSPPDPDDEIPADFFLGAALSYKSYQLARDKKPLAAIKLGLTSIRHLKNTTSRDSTFCDPLVGVGSYLYWRSRLTRMFNWLPFFADEREKGIEMLKEKGRCSLLTRHFALSNLAWIYIEEERYAEAVEAAEQGLALFPQSRFFLWPLAEAHFRAGDHRSSLLYFVRLLNSIRQEPINNRYNEIVVQWKIANSCAELEMIPQAISACEQLLALEPDPEVADRAEQMFRKADKLLQQLRQEMAVSPGSAP